MDDKAPTIERANRWGVLAILLAGIVPAVIALGLLWLWLSSASGFQVRFLGPLPLWLGLILAVAGGAMAWFYYRREHRRTRNPWVAALAWLRAIAIALILLMLVGATVSYRSVVGELGRIPIYVDASSSMGTLDASMSTGRKLLVAREHGWIDKNAVDTTLADAAEHLREVERLVDITDETASAAVWQDRREQIIQETQSAADLLRAARLSKSAQAAVELGPLGGITLEVWKDMSGTNISNLTRDARYPDKPDLVEVVDRFSGKQNFGDNYGQRMRGYLHPPMTGKYRFMISSDDASELRLGVNDDPASAQRIAGIDTYTTPDDFRYRSQTIQLEAGRRYYIEALQKEGGGADHLIVGWVMPDGTEDKPIPGRFLSPVTHHKQAPGQVGAHLADRLERDVIQAVNELERVDDESGQQRMRDIGVLVRSICDATDAAFEAEARKLVESEKGKDLQRGIDRVADLTRWQRVENLLLERKGLLEQLASKHDVEVVAVSGQQTEPLWSFARTINLPENFNVTPTSSSTDLGEPLRSSLLRLGLVQAVSREDAARSDASTQPRISAVVLLTDGQHNDASSQFTPTNLSQMLGAGGVPLYTVGVGAVSQPEDLAVLGADRLPQEVFIDHDIRGDLLLLDTMKPGKPFSMQLEYGGKVVWQEQLVTTGQASSGQVDAGLRRIPFNIPIRKILGEQEAEKIRQDSESVPLSLTVSVTEMAGESSSENNTSRLLTRIVTHPRRLLIVDQVPRWDYQFVRDMFKRDPQWEVTAVLPVRNKKDEWVLPRQPVKTDSLPVEALPENPEDLNRYDLIVIGDMDPRLFTIEERHALRDYVRVRGGGLIFMDGRYNRLSLWSADAGKDDAQLLPPVTWEGNRLSNLPCMFKRTAVGKGYDFLDLETLKDSKNDGWSKLPAPRSLPQVKAAAGTETLVELQMHNRKAGEPAKESESQDKGKPLIVLQRLGSGRVLYVGFDETWRWRYEVADRYQRAFWQQMGEWVAEKPFHVRTQQVALGLDRSRYRVGEQAQIRARLFDDRGEPIREGKVQAVVEDEGRVVSRVELVADASGSGVFRGQTSSSLPAGDYQLRLETDLMKSEPLKEVVTPFQVLDDIAVDGELGIVYLDEPRLMRMSGLSGGRYYREEQVAKLVNRLNETADTRVVTNEIQLWRSFWWFVPILAVLATEWTLRKRLGLV